MLDQSVFRQILTRVAAEEILQQRIKCPQKASDWLLAMQFAGPVQQEILNQQQDLDEKEYIILLMQRFAADQKIVELNLDEEKRLISARLEREEERCYQVEMLDRQQALQRQREVLEQQYGCQPLPDLIIQQRDLSIKIDLAVAKVEQATQRLAESTERFERDAAAIDQHQQDVFAAVKADLRKSNLSEEQIEAIQIAIVNAPKASKVAEVTNGANLNEYLQTKNNILRAHFAGGNPLAIAKKLSDLVEKSYEPETFNKLAQTINQAANSFVEQCKDKKELGDEIKNLLHLQQAGEFVKERIAELSQDLEGVLQVKSQVGRTE